MENPIDFKIVAEAPDLSTLIPYSRVIFSKVLKTFPYLLVWSVNSAYCLTRLTSKGFDTNPASPPAKAE